MEILKQIIAKELVWFIAALVLAFPLALVPMAVLNLLVDDYNAFLTRIDGQVVILYFLLVIACFLGVFLIRIVASAIQTIAGNMSAS